MLDFIKDYFRKRAIRSRKSDLPTSLMPESDIHSALVLLDLSEDGVLSCKERVQSFCDKRRIHVDFIFVDTGRADTESDMACITKKDVNWYGRPSARKADTLCSLTTDLFLSLVNIREFAVDYIANCSRAGFKVGRSQVMYKPFDLVVEDAPGVPQTQIAAFEAIIRMISTIRKQ